MPNNNNNAGQPQGSSNHSTIDWNKYDVIMVNLWKEGKSDKQVEKHISELAETEGRAGGISLKSVKNRKKKYASELRGSKALVYTSKDDVLQQLIELSDGISIASSGGTIIDSSRVPDKKKRKILNYHFKSFRSVYSIMGDKTLYDSAKPLEQKLVEKLRSLNVEFQDNELFQDFLRRCKAAGPTTPSSDSLNELEVDVPVTPVRSFREPLPIQENFNTTRSQFSTGQYNAGHSLAQRGYNPWQSGMYTPSTITDAFAQRNMSVFSTDDQPHASPATSTHTPSALTTCSPTRGRDWVHRGEDASHHSGMGGLGMPVDKPSSQSNQRDFDVWGAGLGTNSTSGMNLPPSHIEPDLNIHHDSTIKSPDSVRAFVHSFEEFMDPRTATPPISLPNHQDDTLWTPLGQLDTRLTHQPPRRSARSERSHKRIQMKKHRNQSIVAASDNGSYILSPSASLSLPYLGFPSDRGECAQPILLSGDPVACGVGSAYRQYNTIQGNSHSPSNFSVQSVGTIVDPVPTFGQSASLLDFDQAAPPVGELDWDGGMVPGMMPDDVDRGETKWLLELVPDPEDPQPSSGNPLEMFIGHSSYESAMPIQMSQFSTTSQGRLQLLQQLPVQLITHSKRGCWIPRALLMLFPPSLLEGNISWAPSRL